MSAFGLYLRQTKTGYLHWCPGCNQAHHIHTGPGPGPKWEFNGSAEKPNFNHSIRVSDGRREPDGLYTRPIEYVTICHYYLHDGTLEFCADCMHVLASQKVPLPVWPHPNWSD